MISDTCPVCNTLFEDNEKVYECPDCNILIHLHCDREHSFQVHAPAYQEINYSKEDSL